MPRPLPVALALGATVLLPAGVALPVTPQITCVAERPAGGFTGYWGYADASGRGETITAGSIRNRFTPGPADRGQPGTFAPDAPPSPGFADDRTFMAAAADFTAFGIEWRLDGRRAAATATTPRCAFDLAGQITPDRATVRPGQSVQWRVSVRNEGTGPVPRAQIALTPAGLDGPLISAPAPDEILPGETLTLLGSTRVGTDACFGTVAASANLAIGPGVVRTPEADLTDNAPRATVGVACTVDLQVVGATESLSYAPGQTAVHTVTVINGGDAPVPVALIRVAHSRATGLAPPGIAPLRLEPGQSLVYRGTSPVTAAQCGLATSTASVTVADPSGRLTEGVPANDSWVSTFAVAGGACGGGTVTGTPGPRLRATAAGPAQARRGRTAVYLVRVRNVGNRPARSLVVRTTLPPGGVLAQRLGRGDVVTGNVLWKRAATLRAGATFTARVRVRFRPRVRGERRILVRAEAANAAPVRALRLTRVR